MKYTFIAFAYLALFSLGFLDNSRGPVYPEILNYFQISKASGGLIFSLSSLSAFIISLFAKKWLGSFGAIGASRIALVCHLISFLIMGLVPPSTIGHLVFLVASFVFGFGLGILSISLNLIISESTTVEKRRQVFSGLHSMYGIASLLAPFIVGRLYSQGISWQAYFLVLCALPVIGLVHSLFLKNTYQAQIEVENNFDFNKKQQIWISIIFAGYISGEILIASRLVVYLSEVKGISSVVSSEALSLFFLCLLSGRLFFTFVKVNIDSKKLLIISSAGSSLCLILGIIYYPVFLSISGLAMSYFFPCAMNLIGEAFPEDIGVVVSKVMMVAGAVLVIMHWSFGILASYLGLDIAIWLAPLFHIAVLYILQFKCGFLAKN
ncbi:MAG: fucose permease [Bacteriovoracaceae bacterium]|jgi:FHS family glucose/mannose:H+ symporter-like MFS transporter